MTRAPALPDLEISGIRLDLGLSSEAVLKPEPLRTKAPFLSKAADLAKL